jgi:hypothetical protein
MKTSFSFLIALLSFLSVHNQGRAQTPANILKSFSKISVSGSADVVFIPSQVYGYTIEDPKSAKEGIVDQTGDEVKILYEKNEKLLITLYGTCPKRIEIRGAGDFSSKGEITNCSPELILSGAGDLMLGGDFGNVSVSISGAGNIELSGKCTSLDATISGAGDLDARKLDANAVKVSISGAGDAKVNALNSLDASVSGVGSILYSGDPQERKVRISGLGSVRQTGRNAKESEEEGGSGKSSQKDDTTSIRIGGTKIIIIEDETGQRKGVEIEDETDDDDGGNNPSYQVRKAPVKNIWSGFELGINGYYHEAFKSFAIPMKEYELDYPRSININFNPLEGHLRIIRNYLTLGYGMGFTFNRFMFDKSISLTANSPILDTIMAGVDYRKNMLKVSYLTLPLFLQFATHANPKKAFHLGAGIVGGIRLGSRTKQIWDENGRQKKVVKDSYNLNPFRYSLMLRVGFRGVNLYADYALSGMFKNGKGPELYPFSAGITLIPFGNN